MVREYFNCLKKFLLKLNLYKNYLSTEQSVFEERLSTRIFLCSLLCFILIIGTVTGLMVRTVNRSEESPSVRRFEYLIKTYPKTVYCPCSKVGVSYETFVSVEAKFHQVCSSGFVNRWWIEENFAQRSSFSSKSDDFRWTVSFFWQTIADLCRISREVWHEAIFNFNTSFILSPEALAEEVLRSEVSSELRTHVESSETRFIQYLLTIRRMIAGNHYVSAVTTNFYYVNSAADDTILSHNLHMLPKEMNGCSCLRITGCPRPAIINDNETKIIAGMITDCYVVDATLSSTLECYYNESCFFSFTWIILYTFEITLNR